MPSSLKRKRPGASASSSRVDAAPSLTQGDEEEESGPARPDLAAALKDQFGPAMSTLPAPSPTIQKKKKVEGSGDGYDEFLRDVIGGK